MPRECRESPPPRAQARADANDLAPVEAASAQTGIPARTLRHWIATGKLPAIADGRRRLISLAAVRLAAAELGRAVAPHPAGSAPGAAPAPAPPADATNPAPVGRSRERASARAALAAALAGRGRVVLLGGDAGIGKTTLAAGIAREALSRGALVGTGHCYDLTDAPPYAPWQELLRSLRARLHEEGADLALPSPLHHIGRSPTPTGGSSAAIAHLLLDTLAVRRPLVLLIEDLHWSDPASLELLRVVARQIAARPVLLLLTYRTDELPRGHLLHTILPRLVREAAAERLSLGPLDTDAVRLLVRERYHLGVDDEGRLVGALQARAEGNPFFIGEFLRAIEAAGALRPEEGRWLLGDLARLPVPALLREIVEERVTRLGAGAWEALTCAAAIGQEVPLATWSRLTGLAEGPLLDIVDRAFEAAILVAAADGATVRFAHALVRAALYEALSPPRRRVHHRAIGEILAGTAGGTVDEAVADPDAVAYHFRQAGDPRTVEWTLRAAERAEQLGAYRTAAERLAAALAAQEEHGSAARARGWVALRLALVRRLHDPHHSLASLDTVSQLATEAGDATLAAYALFLRGLLHCATDAYRRGLVELAEGIAAIAALDPRERVWLLTLNDPAEVAERDYHGVLVNWLAHVGDYAEAERRAGAALGGTPNDRAEAYLGLGYAHAALGRPEEARAAHATATALARSCDNDFFLGIIGLHELIWVALPYAADRPDEWRRQVAELEASWQRRSRMRELALAPRTLLLAPLIVLGDWREARQLADTTRADENADKFVVAGIHSRLAWLAREQGDAALARALAREWLPDGPATEPGDGRYLDQVLLLQLSAALALDEGDIEMARAWLAAHDRWLAWNGTRLYRAEGLVLRARYHRAAGDLARAVACGRAALAAAGAPRQPLALLAAHRLLGELDTAAGRHDDARAHLDASLALADACAAPYERALTALALAELQFATGERAAASAALEAARATCATLGARPALARATALAAAHGVAAPPPLARPVPGGNHALTPREVEVLRLVAAGRSNREISALLTLSTRTIERHIENLYRKIDARSRADATAYAFRHGLVPA